ncbi:hypothetical protein ACH427_04340 [Streptomyces sp. NPDC020379]|uniref:hypothetical protein n=1 Tax=Streptomyces sp. NPDC020379 TaxID=3365071 RepID=UPI0037902F95
MDVNTLPSAAETTPDNPETVATTSPTDAVPGTPSKTFTADDLNRVRSEVKEQLYGRLSAQEETLKQLQEELATQRAAREAEEQAKADIAKRADEEAEAKRRAELSAKALVEEQRTEFEARLAAIEEQRQKEAELYAKERAWQELQQYKSQAVAAAQNEIAPELLDLISGDDTSAIDASIAAMKEKSAQIAASVQQAQTQARANMRGTAPTGYGIGAGGTVGETMELTPEQIRDMPMSQYMKLRSRPNMPGATRASNQGMFG